jgi:SpoVK/Ycf46/Vps4 family AAA+-type ATPase
MELNIRNLTEQIKKDHIRVLFQEPDKLIETLLDLEESIIGASEIKLMIVKKIIYYIDSELDEKGSGLRGNKLHFIIVGNPGTGKTTICKKIADIYSAMGFLTRKRKEKLKNLGELQDQIIRNNEEEKKEYKKIIKNLYDSINHISTASIYIETVKKEIYKDTSLPPSFVKSSISNITSGLNIMKDVISFSNSLKLTPKGVKQKAGLHLDPGQDLKRYEESSDSNFMMITREDLVGGYVGHTEQNLKTLLPRGLGGVIFIDEFYSLCIDKGGSTDGDGLKILNFLLTFMDKHAGSVIFAFGGYESAIEKNIFSKQEGLNSRITDKFKIRDYTPRELTKIYIIKMKDAQGLKDMEEEILKRITGIKFQGNGRDMETLADYTKENMSLRSYRTRTIEGQNFRKVFMIEDLEMALIKFNSSRVYDRPPIIEEFM